MNGKKPSQKQNKWTLLDSTYDSCTWRDVSGWEGKYKVSDRGDVLSVSRIILSKDHNDKPTKAIVDEKILKSKIEKTGYVSVTVKDRDRRMTFRVHKLVAQAFIPNPENKPQINHINGIKTDNRVENLEWCTQVENAKHAVATGLNTPTIGTRHWNHKHSEEDALLVKTEYEGGMSRKQISKKYGYEYVFVYNVTSGQRWKHIKVNNE